MYALVDYKGTQILLKEGENIKVPYQSDLKKGSIIEFDKVLYYFDGKNKKIGNPYIKSLKLKGKVDSHIKDSKITVFKMKRRKGYQKKNGHKQPFTLLKIDKLNVSKSSATKKTAAKATAKSTKKTTAVKKTVATKKTTSKKKD